MNYKIEEKEAFDVLERVETHTVENGQNKTSIPDFWSRAYADGSMEKLESLASDEKYVFGICYGNEKKNDPTFE